MSFKSVFFTRPAIKAPSSNYFQPIFFILLLALLLRLPRMGESLWLDELFNTSWFMRDWFEAILHSLRREYLPVYYLLMYGWARIFGESEILLRMPALFAGLISIYLAYLIAELKLGRKPACFLALLLAISPTHIWYSSESRPYELCSMLLLLSLFSFWKLSDRSKASVWDWVFFVSTFLASFTMLYMPFFTAVFLLASLMSRAPGRKRSLFICVIILFSLAVFLLIKNYISPFPHQYDYLRWFNFIELWMLFFNWYAFGNAIWTFPPYAEMRWCCVFQYPQMIPVQLCFLFLFIRGTVALWKDDLSRKMTYGREMIALLWIVPLFLLLMGILGFKNIYIQRTCYPALPLFWICLVSGVLSIKKKVERTVATLLLGFLSLTSLSFFLMYPNKPSVNVYRPDWRSAAKYISNEIPEKGDKFAIYSSIYSAEPLSFYLRQIPYETKGYLKESAEEAERVALLLEKLFGKQSLFQRIRERGEKNRLLSEQTLSVPRFDVVSDPSDPANTRGLERIYLIESSQWPQNTAALLDKLKKIERFMLVQTVKFKGVKIYEFKLNDMTNWPND